MLHALYGNINEGIKYYFFKRNLMKNKFQNSVYRRIYNICVDRY